MTLTRMPGYRPRRLGAEQEAEQSRRRSALAVLAEDVQVWEVKLVTGFLYFGLCGQPESARARESRTREPATYARHVAVWFALVDRWAAAVEELYAAGWDHDHDPPDLPYLLGKYAGD